ncbi:MAG: hypothetical protein HY721_07780 [Planctomycetes bacterium]|nr:hypothetical protein [Planctomycetota bacterium]
MEWEREQAQKTSLRVSFLLSLSLSLSSAVAGDLIDTSRADLDGDGKARPEEAITLDQFLELAFSSGKGADYIVQIVQAYLLADSTAVVDLSKILVVSENRYGPLAG